MYFPPLIHDKPYKRLQVTTNRSGHHLIEKAIQDQILQFLQYQPKTFVWRQNAGSMFVDGPTGRHGFRSASVSGISDILGVWNGIPLAIEVKQPGKKPTELQRAFLSQFAAAGGLALVASSLEGVTQTLKAIQAQDEPFKGALVLEVNEKGGAA